MPKPKVVRFRKRSRPIAARSRRLGAMAVSTSAFNDALELDGVIMTKLDGDARGGALLSVKHVTGVPVKLRCGRKFCGWSKRPEAFG